MNDLDFSALPRLLPAPKGEPRTNAYKGACLCCGDMVAPSAGYVVADGGKWLTLCKSKRCYAATFGQDAADSVGRRWIDADGVLHMPYDKAALPLVRALATWDHEEKHWQVLTGLGDMPLVEDLAERLGVELPPEWKWRDEPASVTERVKRAAENGGRGYQLKGVRWLALHERACLADDMGLGKQQPVDTPVMTPNGWRSIGSLTVGDSVVGSDGQPTRVTGVFPQGIKQSFRVLFSDGSNTEAGPEHLWTVYYRRGGKVWAPLTVTTEQLRTGATVKQRWDHHRSTSLDLSKTKLYLPMLTAPVDFPAADLPVPPYTLGALIANGGLTHGTANLTVGACDWPEVYARLQAENADIRSVRQYVPTVITTTVRGVIGKIRTLDLDVGSRHKHIPDQYKLASPEQRIALLHGLMDGDGSCSATQNRVTYHTTSETLARDVRDLVEGLGGIASVKSYDRSHDDKPTDYAVRIRLPSSIPPFTVSRKAARYQPGSHASPARTFVSAEYVREAKSVCISVEAADNLYVTERCILTHNTFQILHATPADEGLVVVCPAVAKGVWLREIAKWLPERFYNVVVCTGRGSFRWPTSPRECVILNYDILPPQPSEKSKHASAGKPSCPVTIVADEAHYLKNNKAQRTKRFRSLAAHGSHVYGATGTPVESKPTELWGVLTSLGCNAMSWTAFLRAFNGYKGKFGLEFGRDAEGSILVEPGTTEILSRTMLRRTKAEVAQELPPKVYSEHVVPISPKIVKQLDELAAVWADYLLADELPPFEAMAGVRKVLAQTRIAEAEKLVAEYEEQGVPVVVFSAHRAPAEALAKRKGWGSIIGGMKAADRTAMEDAFQRDELKGLACTIRAAGTAITLTKASSMIFVDLDWNPSANTQAEDRCHRIGQDASSVDIVRMVSDHPLDRHVAYLLHTKSTFVDATLHGRVELSAASQPAKLVDEDESAWSQRVDAKQTQDEQRERDSRTKALREIASRGNLTPAQAEQRAALRLSAREIKLGIELTEEFAGLVQEAFAYMLSVCDGAQEKDDHGFNSPDAAISRWVAPAVRAGSPAALTCAYTMLRHYPRQLSARWGELFA